MSTEKPVKPQCCGYVWNGYTDIQCPKSGKIKRQGTWYCALHDPVARKAKREVLDAKRKAIRDTERIAMEADQRMREAYPLLLEAAKLSIAECDAFAAALCTSPVCSALRKAVDVAEGRS